MIFDKLKTEFIGTFMIVYLTGLLYITLEDEPVSLIKIATGSFLILSLVTWSGRAISGAQYNPAITISLAITRHIKLSNACLFMTFQLLASFFALSLLKITIPSDITFKLIENTMFGFPLYDVSIFKIFTVEAIGTFFLVLAYYLLLLEKSAPKFVYGAGLGAVVFANTIFAFGKSGSGMNPARMAAYCFVTAKFGTLFSFVVGPIVGGVLGGLLGNQLLSEKALTAKVAKKEVKRKRTLSALKKK
jgi:glycerol uptake facilitator-like aquaporin